MDIVGIAIRNARLTISLMLFLTLAGALAYRSIPKEAEPDVQIPIIYVSMSYSGISPEDSERLLLRPMETRLKTIANVKEMTARAFQGGGNVVVDAQADSADESVGLGDTFTPATAVDIGEDSIFFEQHRLFDGDVITYLRDGSPAIATRGGGTLTSSSPPAAVSIRTLVSGCSTDSVRQTSSPCSSGRSRSSTTTS